MNLNAQKIITKLTQGHFATPYHLQIFPVIGSTNQYLKDFPPSEHLEICCAESQTQGRGRFGRHWHSPFGENIYCSSRWNLGGDASKFSGLSLIVSLSVLHTIKQFIESSDIQVKWPNDIYWMDKKLSGSLIEIQTEPNGPMQVIIGIGLNVNTDTVNQPLVESSWCSLYEISQKQFNRNELIAALLVNLELYLNQFMAQGLCAFLKQWDEQDYLAGKQITVTQALSKLTGIAKGINHLGQLILQDEFGKTHHLSSGDTSLQ